MLYTSSLARPNCPKTSFNTYGGIVFGLQPKDPDVSVYYTACLLGSEGAYCLVKYQDIHNKSGLDSAVTQLNLVRVCGKASKLKLLTRRLRTAKVAP
jgi:hypothetical protein